MTGCDRWRWWCHHRQTCTKATACLLHVIKSWSRLLTRSPVVSQYLHFYWSYIWLLTISMLLFWAKKKKKINNKVIPDHSRNNNKKDFCNCIQQNHHPWGIVCLRGNINENMGKWLWNTQRSSSSFEAQKTTTNSSDCDILVTLLTSLGFVSSCFFLLNHEGKIALLYCLYLLWHQDLLTDSNQCGVFHSWKPCR